MSYKFVTEDLTPQFIFNNIDQLAVINYYYNANIELKEHVCNIFRATTDNNAGAWFEYYNNRLVIVDFADPQTNRKDIIGLTGILLKLNFNDSLTFLYNTFIVNKPTLNFDLSTVIRSKKEKAPLQINYAKTKITKVELEYCIKRSITEENLKEDNVFRCSYFEFYTNSKQLIKIKISPNEPCFLYEHYKSGAIKIYRPLAPKNKFTTNVLVNDIGLLHIINLNVNYIILTKSYKDARILINLGYNAVYLMNETALPDEQALSFLLLYDYVYIIFDNDFAGHRGALNLKNHTFSIFNKEAKIITYDFWNDTDVYYLNNKDELIQNLNEIIL